MKLLTFKQWGLSARLLVLISIPLVCISLLTVHNINTTLNREAVNLQNRGEKLLLLAADAAQLALFAGDEAALSNLASAIMRDSQIAEVYFFDEGRRQLGERTNSENYSILKRNFVNGNHYIEGDYWYFVRSVNSVGALIDDDPEQYVDSLKEEILGWVVLVVDLSGSRNYQGKVLRTNLSIALLMLTIALWLAFRFSRAVINPINKITSAVERYGQEDFSRRVDELSPGELGTLEKGINKLAEQLSQSQNILREEVAKATKDLELQNIDLAEAKKNADKASAAKDDFMARMSHELRTPLTAIIGFIRLLGKTDKPKVREEYSDIILASTSVLLSTINDILDFSKQRANSFVLNPTRFNLEDCLREVLDLHRLTAFEKAIELNILIDYDVPLEVLADNDKLQKIVNNIISNAVKFTASGDIIIFVASQKLPADEAIITISIRDSGEGINSSDIRQLFNPFFQCDESSTRSHDGTGLGLSITKDFVTLMGGEISVESELGEGTEFEFTFHCRYVSTQGDSLIGEKKWRAVIYDNNPWTRRSWRNQLLKYSSNVQTPIDIDGLFKALKSTDKLDALLLGFNCHGQNMEGIDCLLTKIRGSFNGMIILATADDGSMMLDKLSEQYSPLILVNKPLSNSRLRGALNKVITNFDRFFVSAAKNELTVKPRVFNSAYNLKGLKVLVAEDNKFNQQLLAALLEAVGAVVMLASNGEEAKQCCANSKFDILLLDLHMPKLNGLQVSETIRNNNGINASTPIILLTADVMSQQASSVIAIGINAISYKPIDEKDLIEKIRALSVVHVLQPAADDRALITLSSSQIEAEVSHQLAAIKDVLDAKNIEAVKQQVHQLMGIAGLSGIKSINGLVADLNNSALHGDVEVIAKCLSKLTVFWSTVSV